MGYCTQLLYPIIMTEQQIAVIVVQMYAVAFAIAEHFAVGALSFACPFTVAVRFEFVVPDVDDSPGGNWHECSDNRKWNRLPAPKLY